MSEMTPSLFSEAVRAEIKAIFQEALQEAFQGQNGNHNEGQLLSPEHAAERLDMPVSKVRELARRGELVSVRIGHYVRFSPADLARFIEGHKEQSPSK